MIEKVNWLWNETQKTLWQKINWMKSKTLYVSSCLWPLLSHGSVLITLGKWLYLTQTMVFSETKPSGFSGQTLPNCNHHLICFRARFILKVTGYLHIYYCKLTTEWDFSHLDEDKRNTHVIWFTLLLVAFLLLSESELQSARKQHYRSEFYSPSVYLQHVQLSFCLSYEWVKK